MHFLEQPDTLQSLATQKLCHWISSQAVQISYRDATDAGLLSLQMENIRNYLKRHMPRILFGRLATEVINAMMKLVNNTEQFGHMGYMGYQRNLVVRMIGTLYSENITCASFEPFNPSLCLDESSNIYLKLNRLLWYAQETNTEADIIILLKELINLKYLTLRYWHQLENQLCVDNILRCAANNCKLIEGLDLSYSPCVNDHSVCILTRLRNLKRVDVRATAVTEKGIAVLLMYCTNLEHISSDRTEHALQLIAFYKENTEKRFQLRSFENKAGTTLEQMQLVVKMCPLMQKMSLTKHYPQQNYLTAVNHLQHLRELELSCYDFFSDQIKEVLEICGRNLMNLDLQIVGEIDLNALKCINRACPNLQFLFINFCVVVKETFDFKSSLSEIAPFKHLESLTLSLESHGAEEVIIFLLTNSPNVEFINISGSADDLKDELMLQVLDKNPLNRLKMFKIGSHKLSKSVIDRLTRNCVLPIDY